MTKYLESGPMFFSNVKGSTTPRDPKICAHEKKRLVSNGYRCLLCGEVIEDKHE